MKKKEEVKSEFKLGDKVRMTGTVEKVRTHGVNEFGRTFPRTEFHDAPVPSKRTSVQGLTFLEHGVIVGQRTIQPGRVDYGGWDEPTIFYADAGKAENVWLVAFELRRKPVMCRTTQLTAEGEDDA